MSRLKPEARKNCDLNSNFEKEKFINIGESKSSTKDIEIHIEELEGFIKDGTLHNNAKLHPLDGKWSWLVCFCGVTCNIIVFGCTFNFGLLYPSLLKEFGESKASTALVGSLLMCLVYAFSPLAALLFDRFGARRLSFTGGLLCTVGLACSSFVRSLPFMFLNYSILFGFGASCVQATVYLIVPRYFKKRASFALGITCMASGGGLLIFGRIIGESLDAFGWRMTYLVMGAMAALTIVLGATFDGNVEGLKNNGLTEILYPPKAKTYHIVAESGPVIWKNYPFLIFNALTAALEFSHAIIFVHLANYTQQIGITPDQSDMLYQVLGVTSMISRVCCGYLLDKCTYVTPIRCYRFGSFAVGIVVITCPYFSQFHALVGFAAAFGFFYGIFQLSLYAYMFYIVSLQARSKAFGFSNLVTSAGYFGGPPFAGFLVDYLQSYPSVFYLAGGIELLSCLLSSVLECFKPPKWKTQAPSSYLSLYHEDPVVEMLTVV